MPSPSTACRQLTVGRGAWMSLLGFASSSLNVNCSGTGPAVVAVDVAGNRTPLSCAMGSPGLGTVARACFHEPEWQRGPYCSSMPSVALQLQQVCHCVRSPVCLFDGRTMYSSSHVSGHWVNGCTNCSSACQHTYANIPMAQPLSRVCQHSHDSALVPGLYWSLAKKD